LALRQGLRHIWCRRLDSVSRLGQIWVRSSLQPVPRGLLKGPDSWLRVSRRGVSDAPVQSKAVSPARSCRHRAHPRSLARTGARHLVAGTSHRVPAK